MRYKMKVKELDDNTNYPLDVLSGMTGLGIPTIQQLSGQGNFAINSNQGMETVNGREFLDWAASVGNVVEVEKTHYETKQVNE